MTGRFTAMRRGDREALKALLQDHGAALFALWQALDPEGARGDLAEAAVSVWRSSTVIRDPEDERAAALTVLARKLAAAPQEQGPAPEIDRALFVHAVARAHLATGGAADAALVEEALEEEPALGELAERVRAALDAARATAVGAPSPFGAIWSSVEPRLR